MTSPREVISNTRFNVGNGSSLNGAAIMGAAFVPKNIVL